MSYGLVSDTQVTSIRDLQGCTELWSTCVVRSRHPGSVQAFNYAIGFDVPGTERELRSDHTDTNMRVAGQFVEMLDSGRMGKFVTGIEWCVPEIVSARYLPKQDLAPYHVRLSDVSELLRKAVVRFHVGGEKPYVDVHPGSRPVAWGWNGARQSVRFDRSLPIGRIERFWAEVSFPGDPPIFGKHPDDQAWEASLPVVFRLLEDDGPAAKQAVALDAATGLVSDLRKIIDDVKRLIPPPTPPEDAEVLAEIQKLRSEFGTTDALLDLLRSVQKGVNGK
jgi:hypothetical protein